MVGTRRREETHGCGYKRHRRCVLSLFLPSTASRFIFHDRLDKNLLPRMRSSFLLYSSYTAMSKQSILLNRVWSYPCGERRAPGAEVAIDIYMLQSFGTTSGDTRKERADDDWD